jgi:hypothetical protein
LLWAALAADEEAVRRALDAEQELERTADREYWTPLKRELERLRAENRRPG